jgi:hypothetical protein
MRKVHGHRLRRLALSPTNQIVMDGDEGTILQVW